MVSDLGFGVKDLGGRSLSLEWGNVEVLSSGSVCSFVAYILADRLGPRLGPSQD